MGLGSTIGGFIKKAAGTLLQIVDQVRQIVGVFINIKDYTVGAFTEGMALIQDVETAWDDIVHFDLNPKWNSRVISVPKVFVNIKELAQIPQTVIDAVKGLIQDFQNRAELTEALEAGEEMLPVLGQIFGIATLIAEFLLEVRKVIDDLKSIVDAIKTVVEDLSHLDGLFLQQKNPRQWTTERVYKRIS